MTGYPRLLEPLTVGSVTLRNRIVMGAMHTRLETLDRPTERIAAFYAARARGEAGLILTNGYAPNAEGRLEEDSEVFDDATDLGPHRVITSAVHRAGTPSTRWRSDPAPTGPASTRSRPGCYRPVTSGTPSPRSRAPPNWPGRPATTGWKSWDPRDT
jgi:2,4-dienoyl-CoA reductase (NADPH2)